MQSPAGGLCVWPLKVGCFSLYSLDICVQYALNSMHKANLDYAQVHSLLSERMFEDSEREGAAR